jgi:hypothetical protein
MRWRASQGSSRVLVTEPAMTLDEAVHVALESLVADGIFVRTGEYDPQGNPLCQLAPVRRHLSEAELALRVDRTNKGTA